MWIDRRLDRSSRVTLSVEGQSLADTLQALAAKGGASTTRFGELIYVGPRRVADRLNALAAARRRRSPAGLRRRRERAWDRLTTPAELVAEIARDARVRVRNPDAIPHDLWPAGRVPKIPLGDQLTLVLAGFDLTWRHDGDDRNTVRIAPIDYATLDIDAPRRERERDQPEVATESRFTLRVIQQPALAILAKIAEQTGRKIEYVDTARTRAERRITVEVRGATLDELLAAIGEAASLNLEVDPNRLVVSER